MNEVGSHRNQQCGRSQNRNNRRNDRSRSKSRNINIERHYCHKKGHFNKDCYSLKNKEKGDTKSRDDGHARQSSGTSS